MRDRIEHADLARHLERMVEHRQHGARDQTHLLRALRGSGQEQQRVGRVAAVGGEVVLDHAHVRVAEVLAKLAQIERIVKIRFRRDLVSDRREELQTEFHCPRRLRPLCPALLRPLGSASRRAPAARETRLADAPDPSKLARAIRLPITSSKHRPNTPKGASYVPWMRRSVRIASMRKQIVPRKFGNSGVPLFQRSWISSCRRPTSVRSACRLKFIRTRRSNAGSDGSHGTRTNDSTPPASALCRYSCAYSVAIENGQSARVEVVMVTLQAYSRARISYEGFFQITAARPTCSPRHRPSARSAGVADQPRSWSANLRYAGRASGRTPRRRRLRSAR